MNKTWESLKGFRTLGLSVGTAAVGAALLWFQSGGAAVIPGTYLPFILIGLGAVNAWLRTQTDTSAGQSVEASK